VNKNNQKNILVISHNYWPAIGGAEKLFQSMAENLKKFGLKVQVLTSNAKNAAMYFNMHPETVGHTNEVINGVVVHREDIRNIIQKLSKIFWSIFIKKSSKNNSILPILIGPHFIKSLFVYIFSKNKYTHIIAGPFPTSVPFYGYLFKIFSPKSKFILCPCLHVNDPTHKGKLLRFIASKADTILVLTREETQLLIDWGIDKSKIIETGVGIDDEFLKTKLNKKLIKNLPYKNYILFIGQEVQHKNIIDLIDAMEILWKKGIKENLVLAGARTEYSKIIDNKISLMDANFQKRIFRVNNFDEKDKINLLDGCRTLILPSSMESFGIVIIEAWARKKPVIAANIPSIRYLIDDKQNGLLFRENDINDLKEKILVLLTNTSIYKNLSKNGFNKVIEHYQWEKIINKIFY